VTEVATPVPPHRVVDFCAEGVVRVGDSLERARERRAGLHAAIVDVEGALAAPAPRREELWRKELSVALGELGDALERHIATTEAGDGLLAEILSSAPRLAHRIDRARADHERLRSSVQQSITAVDDGADVDTIREGTLLVLAELVRHRQLGSDLVYDAYNVDIEGGE
jgi:hypothetical protein